MAPQKAALSREDASELTDALFEGLRGAARSHYESLEAADLARRCWRLVEAFIAAMGAGPAVFVEYVRRITEERIAEGFHLAEIQQALSLLEARAWRIVVDRSSVALVVPHLSVVTGTVGAAKDELARLYLAHKQRAEADLARLQASRLFEGTDGRPEIEEGEPEPAPAGAR